MRIAVLTLVAARFTLLVTLGISGASHARDDHQNKQQGDDTARNTTGISVQFPDSYPEDTQALTTEGSAAEPPAAIPTDYPECVILLHGLARTGKSMKPLGDALVKEGYLVVNVDYPSRKYPVATLTEMAIPPALDKCRQYKISGISVVAHSLGGILVRHYLSQQSPSPHKIPELKRVVMLAPPNKGSEITDNLRDFAPYEWLNGPAGDELGTEAESVPNTLGPVDFDLGVIAGTTSINLLLSQYLPNPDDGKVSVESTKIEGMRDFITLPVSHPFIMKDDESIAQIIHFLRDGKFLHSVSDE